MFRRLILIAALLGLLAGAGGFLLLWASPGPEAGPHRVTVEEGGQSLGHAVGILHLQQVCRTGKDEGLDVLQPGNQEFLSLAPDGVEIGAPRSDNRKDRLGDAARGFADVGVRA